MFPLIFRRFAPDPLPEETGRGSRRVMALGPIGESTPNGARHFSSTYDFILFLPRQLTLVNTLKRLAVCRLYLIRQREAFWKSVGGR
jgi:hypothetical protein